MAVAAQKTVASLMRKTLDRQAEVARLKLKFKNNQIEKILVNYSKDGNLGPYSELIKVLQEFPINEENYKVLLEDSLSCIVLLGRELKLFVDVVCNLEWLSRSEESVELYYRFILGLVTAHTYHCPRVMSSLVKLFKGDGENWDTSPPDKTVVLWSKLHTILAQIVAIMPLTSDLLMQTIIDQFPYYKAGCYPNRAYIHNMIWMTRYIPSLREQIISAIINRMVVMDVNLVEQSNSKAKQTETLFEMDVDDQEQDKVSDTLDCCMLEVLQWLEDERTTALTTMCRVFERVVLPTYGIRHVQFLLLYTISISQQCADSVLNSLWTVAAGLHSLGPGALTTRRIAASHLAGLLARCVRVPNTRLIHYLKSMSDWCHGYVTATQESTATCENNNAHGAFYAICHAIFYLIAFKNHHLFSSKENINFVESLNLPRLVTCALNPLRPCPPQVQRAFAAVTRAHQLLYCQPVIERNARRSLLAPPQQYDDWFPYDPYTLPKSGKTIWPLCIEYKHCHDGEDETQYSNMKRIIEAEDDDFLNPSPSKRQRLASSLSNCISPGFKNSESLLL